MEKSRERNERRKRRKNKKEQEAFAYFAAFSQSASEHSLSGNTFLMVKLKVSNQKSPHPPPDAAWPLTLSLRWSPGINLASSHCLNVSVSLSPLLWLLKPKTSTTELTTNHAVVPEIPGTKSKKCIYKMFMVYFPHCKYLKLNLNYTIRDFKYVLDKIIGPCGKN